MLVSAIKAFSVVVADSGAAQSKDLALRVAVSSCVGTPKTDLDGQIAFISYADVSSIFDCAALFDIYLG